MVKMTPLQRYDFKRTIEELEGYKGRATELVTLLIPPAKQISDVSNYLRNELSQSSNIKSKSTKKNVSAAIESILSRLRGIRQSPENGLAFFVGHIPIGADRTRMVIKVVEPPAPLPTFLYRCDSYFYIDYLRDMMMDEDIFGLIVMDRAEATIGFLKGKRVEMVKNYQSLVPSKHGRGGQSAQRFERLIEIAAHEFFKKIGDTCTEVFLNADGLKGILIGGPGATKDFFLRNEFLHHELQKKVIDTFDTGYTDESGLSELIEKARPTLQHLEVSREKELMVRLFEEIRKENGGLAAYGETDVKQALQAGAVDVLLLSEGIRMMHRTFKCPTCGKEFTVFQKAGTDPLLKCQEDGSECDLEKEEDMVEELAKVCGSYSTTFELISTDSSEGSMLLKAFGGLAALLRYRMR